MRYVSNNRGVTLVELLVSLLIGAMIVGLVFLVPQLFYQQSNYNDSFNTAKNKVLLITNTLNKRLAQADNVKLEKNASGITIRLNGTNEVFRFDRRTGFENYLYDVWYQDGSKKKQLGNEVGVNLENTFSDTFFTLTLWAPYSQTNSTEDKFVVTQGFHTSVINQR